MINFINNREYEDGYNDISLSFYSDAGGKGDPAENISKAIEGFMEKLEVVEAYV